MNNNNDNCTMETKLNSLNEALRMLQENYKTLKIIKNNLRIETLKMQNNEYLDKQHLAIDITGELNGIEFETADYHFVNVNLENPIDVYIRLKERYIIPIREGFETWEEYRFSLEQDKINEEYLNSYFDYNN